MPLVYVSIAAHGFGHSAQTAPVLRALRERRPDVRWVIRSALPRELLHRHFAAAFEHLPAPAELGMLMDNALDVASDASFAAHQAFHRDWAARIAREAAALEACGADLVLSNVSYLMPAAAARAGIPSVLLGSLNWADIFEAYCGAVPGADALRAQMLTGYNQAQAFIQLEPHMPMPAIRNAVGIGPVARRGRARPEALRARFGLSAEQRMVLVAMGGIPMRFGVERWPVADDVRYLVPGAWGVHRGDMIPFEALDWDYLDLLASSDAVITKPGYGTFADCACNGVPALYVRRRDWPEERYLVPWFEATARCAELPRAALETGAVDAHLRALWKKPARAAIAPTGIGQAADYLASWLA